jgi:hypothetical protein
MIVISFLAMLCAFLAAVSAKDTWDELKLSGNDKVDRFLMWFGLGLMSTMCAGLLAVSISLAYYCFA